MAEFYSLKFIFPGGSLEWVGHDVKNVYDNYLKTGEKVTLKVDEQEATIVPYYRRIVGSELRVYGK